MVPHDSKSDLPLRWVGDRKIERLIKLALAFQQQFSAHFSILLLWILVTTFLPDRQPPLIFVRFISNFLCMDSNSMGSVLVILK